jgi:Transposase DDE domain
MRRVRALVEVDGKEREMEFLTNNLQWSATSVADLYRCRWQIEVFFKQIKQSLQLCDFLGNNAQCRPLAGLDGAVTLCPNAFSLRDEQLEPLFYQALHPTASHAVEKN